MQIDNRFQHSPPERTKKVDIINALCRPFWLQASNTFKAMLEKKASLFYHYSVYADGYFLGHSPLQPRVPQKIQIPQVDY